MESSGRSPYNWVDVYPELVNKIRWAVSTSLKTPASNYPFPASQVIATVFAQSIIDIAKQACDTPEVVASTSLLRGFLTQETIQSGLDKLT